MTEHPPDTGSVQRRRSTGQLCRFGTVAVFVVVLQGCGGGGISVRRDRLPFSVRLNIEPKEAPDEGRRTAKTQDPFGDRTELKRAVAEKLEDESLFTEVMTTKDGEADLELAIAIEGGDFGSGESTREILSTAVWSVAGFFAWMIDDRRYVRSDFRWRVTIRRLRDGDELFDDVVVLNALELSCWDRAGWNDWFLGIIVPPWVIPGDKKKRDASLAAKAVAYCVREESNRIHARLPTACEEELGCFLEYRDKPASAGGPEAPHLRITTRQAVQGVVLEPEGGGRETHLSLEELARLEESRTDATERKGGPAADRVYRIPLDGTERGVVKVTVELESGTSTWTVRVGGEPSS